MRIYIAHNFAARTELARSVVPYLQARGHEITSRWISDPNNQPGQEWALNDVSDVDKADAVLIYLDNTGNTPGRGKWFEMGYAYARGKAVYAYGVDDQCIFIHLPRVQRIVCLSEIPAVLRGHGFPERI